MTRSSAVLTIFAICWIATTSSGEEVKPAAYEPDPSVQALMAEVLASPDGEQASRRKFDQLMSIAKANPAEFVRQVVFHQAATEAQGAEVGPYWFLAEARLSPSAYAAGLGPLLFSPSDDVRTYARQLFPKAIGCGCQNGQPDLSHIRDYVVGDHQDASISQPLKRAVFEQSPSGAFLLFHTTAERDELIPLRRQERVVANALYEKVWLGGLPDGKIDPLTQTALNELSRSERWWARMFVAEIMVQHQEFRDPEVLARLSEDAEPLVRQSAESIAKGNDLRMTPIDR